MERVSFNRLKRCLNLDVVANLLQKACVDVSDAVVSGVDETATMAVHRVGDQEGLGAGAPGREAFQCLVIASFLAFSTSSVGGSETLVML